MLETWRCVADDLSRTVFAALHRQREHVAYLAERGAIAVPADP